MSNSPVKPLVEAAFGRRPSRIPAWFMRQAGRYLPEYREIRAKTDFVTLCQTPKLAAEVTIQPLRRFDLDAAIIFSDILIPAVGMGQTLSFDKGEGPVLTPAIRTSADLKLLKRPNAERDLGYVGEAITETKRQMKPEQTMIGFAGAPFTVASYMIEGQSSKNFTEVKRMMLHDPATFRGLLEALAETTIDYLAMQVKAGADALMLFDTWAGQLTAADYREFVFPVTKRIIAAARTNGVPVTYYPGQGSDKMHELNSLEVDVISVDWRTRITNAASILKNVGIDVTLQGNLDPQYLIGSESFIRERVRAVLQDAKSSGCRAHIFNVGHGLLPHTPPESLTWVLDELRRS